MMEDNQDVKTAQETRPGYGIYVKRMEMKPKECEVRRVDQVLYVTYI